MSTKHTLELTRGSLYILEGILQDVGPCTTPAKITNWSRLYAKVRSANDRRVYPSSSPEGLDIEKPLIRREGESEIAWATRQQEHTEATEQWRNAPIALSINDKQRDIAREAIAWVTKNQNPAPGSQTRASVRIQMSKNVGTLFAALGFGDEDEDASDGEELKSASAAG